MNITNQVDPKAKAAIFESLRIAGLNDRDADLVFRARVADPKRLKGEPLTVKASATDAKAADIYLYGDIGIDPFTGDGIGAKQLVDQLPILNRVDEIHFWVNSGGGDVFEADAMLSVINRMQARKVMHVDGIAASAASYLIQGGDERHISEHAMTMIHKAWGVQMGNSADMLAMSNVLEKIDGAIATVYARRSGKKAETFRKLMDEEKWFTAQETIDAGLADKMVPGKRVAARFDMSSHERIPEWAKARLAESETPTEPDDSDTLAAHERTVAGLRKQYGYPSPR